MGIFKKEKEAEVRRDLTFIWGCRRERRQGADDNVGIDCAAWTGTRLYHSLILFLCPTFRVVGNPLFSLCFFFR